MMMIAYSHCHVSLLNDYTIRISSAYENIDCPTVSVVQTTSNTSSESDLDIGYFTRIYHIQQAMQHAIFRNLARFLIYSNYRFTYCVQNVFCFVRNIDIRVIRHTSKDCSRKTRILANQRRRREMWCRQSS